MIADIGINSKVHLKCDEKRPFCTRCKSRLVKCRYALDPNPVTIAIKSTLFQQPGTSISPEGISPSRSDIDIFGIFHTEIAQKVCGMLSKNLWLVDVPRAAQIYPALWHASIALAAIHQSEKIKIGNYTISNVNIQRYYYILALSHFNQSTTYVKHTLPLINSVAADTQSYQKQEMVIMTNLLYIGICNMLGDII